MEDISIQGVPEEYRGIYERNWSTINQSVKTWKFKDVYHFPVIDIGNILHLLRDTLNNYNRAIKINASFGFILRERLTDELKFFHPSNNTKLFDIPKMIQNPEDLKKLEEEFEKVDIVNYARKQRPSTKWIVDRIVCMRLDIFKLS